MFVFVCPFVCVCVILVYASIFLAHKKEVEKRAEFFELFSSTAVVNVAVVRCITCFSSLFRSL